MIKIEEMPKSLIIVESPTKATTLKKFLGSDYTVLSSYGHIRDLPKSKLGIEVDKDFDPEYIIPTKARARIKPLKEALAKVDNLILATDEDREGEAIAWHLLHILENPKTYQRIVFHEITKSAILKALKNPRKLDEDLIDAQQARRVLDRLVGYNLSPFLWKKIGAGLSAGRVQSVALRLIVEKEREIEKFKPEEYWSLEALFKKGFIANYTKKPKSKKEVDKILKDLKTSKYKIIKIETKERKRNPLPPFSTSTMQQEASKRFGWPSHKTMREAQGLYEKGLITYHRTDSFNLSSQFVNEVTNYLEPKYLQIRKYKSRSKNAQEAHEGVRPTRVKRKLDNKLYELIWQRAVASQMKPAIFDEKKIDIKANDYLFRANGQTLKFDGYLSVYPAKISENELPELKEGSLLDLKKLNPEQHFTKPPARFNEASLIKKLEELGIGRPSTYAPTIFTIQRRNYVEKEGRSFKPQDIGLSVNDLLVEHFPKIVDFEFTADMEDDLDSIADGKKEWKPIIKDFYKPFKDNLDKKMETVEKKAPEKTGDKCEKCGKDMIIKLGRFGKFISCSGYPDCKNAKPIIKKTGIKCPDCGKGDLIERRTKKGGRKFWGCEKYPDCEHATWDDPSAKKEEK